MPSGQLLNRGSVNYGVRVGCACPAGGPSAPAAAR